MNMGPEFDPHGQLKIELIRRAENLLRTQGEFMIPGRGTTKPGRKAYAGQIFVYLGGIPERLIVRYREMDKVGQPYTLVLNMRPHDGEIFSVFVDLLEIAVKELRQQQILDDLANA